MSGNTGDPWIPYGRQSIDDSDINAVVDVLRSDWLTTGPKVAEFEDAISQFTSASHTIALSNGTAALHAAMYAINVQPGDEVIIPVITFVSSANAVLFQRGKPVFVDVDPETLLIDPAKVEAEINDRTKAILAVDYAGHPCDYDSLRIIARKHNLTLIADATHSLGALYNTQAVGKLADLTIFSFHPVKAITTGEGGAVTTNNLNYASRIRRFRSHGIDTDHRQRHIKNTYHYEMDDIGYNYRISDIQCALGINQLRKLPRWIEIRQEIAQSYHNAFAGFPGIQLCTVKDGVYSAFHLFVIKLHLETLDCDRDTIFSELRSRGVGVNVHYLPVPWHPYYQKLGYPKGSWQAGESAALRVLSLPIFPSMTQKEIQRVIAAVKDVVVRHILKNSKDRVGAIQN